MHTIFFFFQTSSPVTKIKLVSLPVTGAMGYGPLTCQFIMEGGCHAATDAIARLKAIGSR